MPFDVNGQGFHSQVSVEDTSSSPALLGRARWLQASSSACAEPACSAAAAWPGRPANWILVMDLSERIPVAAVEDEISELARLRTRCSIRLSPLNPTAVSPARPHTSSRPRLPAVRPQVEKLLVTGNLTGEQEEAVQMQLEELARSAGSSRSCCFCRASRGACHHIRAEAPDPLRLCRFSRCLLRNIMDSTGPLPRGGRHGRLRGEARPPGAVESTA